MDLLTMLLHSAMHISPIDTIIYSIITNCRPHYYTISLPSFLPTLPTHPPASVIHHALSLHGCSSLGAIINEIPGFI